MSWSLTITARRKELEVRGESCTCHFYQGRDEKLEYILLECFTYNNHKVSA